MAADFQFETTFLTAWDEFVVNECKTVTTMVDAAPIILARNLRVSSFNCKIRLCQLCGILLCPEAKVHVQVEDHTGCVSANMIEETAETFLQCSGQKLMQIAALKNQDILNDIRASTTEEHMLYLKVINNNKKTVALKYDVVFMLEPILDINTALNIGENPVGGFMVEEKTAHRTCINKQPIKAYAQPMLSPTEPVYSITNAIHTCFQTNTVIASRNITDLRLVANITNQSDKTRASLSKDVFLTMGKFFQYAFPSAVMVCTLVSNELGAGKPRAARDAVFVVLILSVSEFIIASTVIFFCRYILGYAFSNEMDVVNHVKDMTPFLCLSKVSCLNDSIPKA
ncbi:Protein DETOXIFICATION [Forsythia ovata]|uniref:Protein DETOXIFICATION n=1 Tax=Forsythia ovata TaxID=205694 RepID=A0ABD1SLF1_9LAMI